MIHQETSLYHHMKAYFRIITIKSLIVCFHVTKMFPGVLYWQYVEIDGILNDMLWNQSAWKSKCLKTSQGLTAFNSTTYMVIGPSRAFIDVFTSFLFQNNSVNWPVFFNVSFPGVCSCYFSADYQVNRTHVFYPIQNLERAFHRFSLHIFSKSGRVCDRDPTRARRGSLLLNCLHSSHLPASE